MFVVDEATAEAIRRALNESGELSAVVELRRHFPLIRDNEQARGPACGRSPRGGPCLRSRREHDADRTTGDTGRLAAGGRDRGL
jgi:hypothetical protein